MEDVWDFDILYYLKVKWWKCNPISSTYFRDFFSVWASFVGMYYMPKTISDNEQAVNTENKTLFGNEKNCDF